MASIEQTYFRPELVARRQRLQMALAKAPAADDLSRLLNEVDAALSRLDSGNFGVCELCHDSVESDRLLADPLVRFCLGHMSEAEQRAHEHDVELAAQIQRTLLPPGSARFGGWELHASFRAAGPVSGDYCDVLRADDNAAEALLLFGDVSGKGVSAGFLMAHLHAIFRTLATSPESVESLVTRANRIFRASSLAPYFATLVCARLGADGAVDVCNAGHCPPLLLSGAEVRTVDPTGLPLGTFLSNRYAARSLRLAAGDTLVLYTDGLTEALDSDGQQYGVERLTATLLADRDCLDEMAARCLDHVAAHRRGTSPQDDQSLLIVRWNGSPAADGLHGASI
jgi:sigma-B regulation protein RsbU (phosphoserine phosphatase)